MIHLSTLLKHYKRQDICEEIVAAARDKEVAVKYGDKGFGKRPDVLNHARDVLEFAKQGATSFHCSEELWHNPLQLDPGMKKQELDELRKGWDLVLDIDCQWLEYSQVTADVLAHALRYHGIEHFGLKFSGNCGFHIAVPAEALPERVHSQPTKLLFPEGPRKIAFYLQEMVREHLASRILEYDSITRILEKTKKKREELIKNSALDPFALLKIDTVLISSRHLYRMPYSFNEKSGLVSIPLNPKKLMEFDRSWAEAERVSIEHEFIPRKNIHPGEATKLLVQAFDFQLPQPAIGQKALKPREDFAIPLAAVPEQFFPPCIQNIAKGLQDGKKRAVFVLINFLSSLGWNHEQIEAYLKAWNSKNPEPLREQYLLGQLRYHQQSKKQTLPPNCANKAYLTGMGVCIPDALCGANATPSAQDFAPRIKNPVNYALRRQKLAAKVRTLKKKAQNEATPVTPAF
jgi:hypothetical protein